jgi:hypothetical protein
MFESKKQTFYFLRESKKCHALFEMPLTRKGWLYVVQGGEGRVGGRRGRVVVGHVVDEWIEDRWTCWKSGGHRCSRCLLIKCRIKSMILQQGDQTATYGSNPARGVVFSTLSNFVWCKFVTFNFIMFMCAKKLHTPGLQVTPFLRMKNSIWLRPLMSLLQACFHYWSCNAHKPKFRFSERWM